MMIPINPATMRLAGTAAAALVKFVPKAQLARFGLVKAPLLGAVPLAGAVLGGAAITALAIPQSRQWLAEQGRSLYGKATGAAAPSKPRSQIHEAA